MIDFEITNLRFTSSEFVAVGEWLEQHMPNPPLPDPQRWTLGYDADNTGEVYRYGIKFENDYDAMMFALRWSR
jgi:hypothetical protein